MEAVPVSLRRAQPLLGCFVEIATWSSPPQDHGAAIDAAFAAVAKVHRLMSFHDPASDVSRLNRVASARSVRVHAWTFCVLQAAIDFHHRSRGAFEIAVAPALQRLGLLPCRPAGRGSTKRVSTSEEIELQPGRCVRFRRPGVRIDLSGLAKGFAVDRAVEALRSHGVTNGLVNAGGDLAAFGATLQPIYIRDPRDPRRLICRVDLADMALASSGRRFDLIGDNGAGDSAVIDPATQAPARATFGATVVAPSCMFADALTKIVMIAPERAGPLLTRHRAHALFASADGDVRVSSNWLECVSRAA